MLRFLRLESNELRICLLFSYAPRYYGGYTVAAMGSLKFLRPVVIAIGSVCLARAGTALATMRPSLG